ncbi:hypothetical protein SSX86_008263 [Deinandra increscens subsp. villosa]|uniref:RNA-directed DNA polymerase n=1 Tax=Deinandra increscens subsp. villosa TaxID=3103831 RepID=A0AAP0H3W9_9ASTR
MPPRKETSMDDSSSPLSEKIDQLITITTTTVTNAASAATTASAQLTALLEATTALTTKVNTLSPTEVHQTNETLENLNFGGTRTNTNTPRPPKINLPMFDGSNPLDWIFQAENYFTYYQIPVAQCLNLAVFYLTGEALSWYKHLSRNELLGTWTTFKRSLELCFGPSTYENHEATLFKLRQVSSVTAYQAEFEKISNRVDGLSQQALRNCFISGLRSDIQNELALLNPTSLHQAYALSKLIEDKLSPSSKPKYNQFPKPTYTSPTPISSNPNPPTSSSKPLLPLPALPKPHSTLPLTKLSPEALLQRRKDGLCFRCPEKFFPGHKCSPPQFLLIVDNDDIAAMPEEDDFNPTPNLPPQFLSLSDAAFFGFSSAQTLRVTGHIAGKPVTILVDCGSTHNIIQPRVASALHLANKPVQPFSVMVGNGQYIQCNGGRRRLNPWCCMVGYCPEVNLRLLPELSFTKDGVPCTLTGEPMAQAVSTSSLSSMIRHDSIASLHTMVYHQPTTSTQADYPPDPIITSLLQQFQPLFEETHGLPPSRSHDHHIPLTNEAIPVNVKPYRYPHFQKQVMTRLITEMLKDGVIRPSQSPFSSPVLLVKKKDGSWRFCVDYRALNAVTIRDRFPIPTIDELHGATIFSKIDLRSGYHQIRVAEADIHKTAFRTCDGHYEFLVMPFGLTNAPSTFQSAMNDLFRKVLRRFVLVFFDDILIYSDTKENHYSHLKFVFETLLQNQFHAKPSKCVFGVQEISFLGHRISAVGVSPEPDKIQAIQQWPQPTSFTTLRAFLGLTGYYRRFVPQYAKVASALTDILKEKVFTWSDAAHEAFNELKKLMEHLVTLALPDFNKEFDVTTDASGTAIGAVLSQDNKPIAFFSKKLCPTMQNQSTYTKELYAITESVKKWRQYLLGRKFRIYTDHHSLKHILTQTIQTTEQQKWVTKLMGYEFEVHYKPGKDNTVADELSRVDLPTAFAISHPTSPWLNEIREYFQKEPHGIQLLRQIQDDPISFPHHALHEGLVYVHGKILVPPVSDLRTRLLEEFHSSVLGGHAGINATARRIASSFSWLGLRKDVAAFIKECVICQATKSPTHKPYGLIQPLPVPQAPWTDISMDFITSLPPSKGKTAIWVIVDRLSKFAHFIPLPTHYTATSLASIFFREVYRLHGLPKTIVSDRDPIFISNFWRELFKQMGTRLLHSSAYHPQTDGQTEVVNRGLEAYLRAFVFDEPASWSRYIYLAEFSYNTSFHTSIAMTPFQAVYGREATSIHEYLKGNSKTASIDESLAEHARLLSLLKSAIERARSRMVRQANKKRMDKEFNLNDYVYLRLQDYRQKSVENRRHRKLSRRFFGPYKIIERVGDTAYRLQLPDNSRIHPVFHVSLLKKFEGKIPTAMGNMDDFGFEGQLHLLPDSILDTRKDDEDNIMVLVKWENQGLEEATWENWEELKLKFPCFTNIEDNVGFQGKGVDMDQPASITTNSPIVEATRPKRILKRPKRLEE